MITTRRPQRSLKVLVTDGNNRAALAITRSLGKRGYTVYVAGESRRTLAGASRYCKRSFAYPDPSDNPEQFRAEIIRQVRHKQIDILIPAAETTTRECMKIKESIRDNCIVPFYSYDAVDQAASKYEVLKLAQTLKVPIPATHFLHAPEEIQNACEFCNQVGYPVAVKASRSRAEMVSCCKNMSTQYANNANELKQIAACFVKSVFPLLIQERIQGDGVGIFTCFDHGKPIAYFSHRRLREKPPSGGVSVLRESYPIEPELKVYSEKLLQALNWHGVAMVEFKKDAKHGGYKLMEINGRFWGSLQLAIDAGVDFPLLLAQISTGQHVKPILNYRLNVRTRWLWGDIDALLTRLFKSDGHLHLPDNFPSKKKYLLDFLRFRRENLNFEVLKLNDPLPWLVETMRWFQCK